jgi:hypothetical protein
MSNNLINFSDSRTPSEEKLDLTKSNLLPTTFLELNIKNIKQNNCREESMTCMMMMLKETEIKNLN